MRRTAMLVSALSLAALGATVGPAQAGPAPADSETRATTFSDQEQDTALEFWTDARLNAAKEMAVPAAVPEAPAGTPSVTSSVDDGGPRMAVPSVVFPDAQTTASAAGETPVSTLASKPKAWKRGGLISRTAGKVFFENAAGGLFACSATVANSKNKSVVLTAGHCVVDARTGEVFRKWIFIPGYHKGERPHGTFTAKKLFHLKSYVSSQGNANWDVAFATLRKRDGRPLAKIVGGAQGIKFNAPNGRYVHSFGYGGSRAEGDGERLNHCQGKEHRDLGRPGSTMWGIDCVQTGGSSGGAFLAEFKVDNGVGVLVGNIAVGTDVSEYHPRLGDRARKLYKAASRA
ncbi:trypsin-like serine peptidase [Streptomyces sp. NBC_00443]|uniref:trypsin-like serine peptidase n=1 Tax=Streptomyces sp. NBC_00443 TaxID=2975743 RepID=UPI002E2222AD